jgi:hypothetical protein
MNADIIHYAEETSKRTGDLLTGKQNSESFPERPVQRRPYRPITFAGQNGGNSEVKMNCEVQHTVLRYWMRNYAHTTSDNLTAIDIEIHQHFK